MWEEKCTELFNQYKERLDEYNDCVDLFHKTLNSMEQCMWFKLYDGLSYWANRAEVGHICDIS